MKLLGFVLECGKALVIAVNKWDGMKEEAREHARATIDRHLDFVRFARVHFISALHGSGVGNLFDSVNEAYESATKKLSTPMLTRLLQKAHRHPFNHLLFTDAASNCVMPTQAVTILHHNHSRQPIECATRKLSQISCHFFQKKLKFAMAPRY